jgi:hypothetical protein
MNTPNAANIMYEAFRNNIIPTGKSIKDGSMSLEKLKNIVKNTESKCTRVNCCKKKKENLI